MVLLVGYLGCYVYLFGLCCGCFTYLWVVFVASVGALLVLIVGLPLLCMLGYCVCCFVC